jgi:hypothetical protein
MMKASLDYFYTLLPVFWERAEDLILKLSAECLKTFLGLEFSH